MTDVAPETERAWQGRSDTVARTLAIGAVVARHAQSGDLIALSGELGAGKTQFVRGLAQGLGATAPVSSPTFVLVQEYESGPGRPPLVHLDAYRLSSLEDLESIGWDVTGPTLGAEMRAGCVVAIEWADRLDELLGDDRLDVRLAHAGDYERTMTLEPRGSWLKRWRALLQDLNDD